MDINYIGYRQDIFSKAVNSHKPVIYVFDNFKNMLQSGDYYEKPFLQKGSIFISFSDLKEKLFPVDRLILKEEKITVIFFELLTEVEKEKLKINNYFDAIDPAAEFFNFFAELNEYNIDKIEDLQGWQQEKYLIFMRIRERYEKRMDNLNFTDRTLAFDFANFNPVYLKNYEGVTLINIINFTPKEKELLTKIEDTGVKLKLYLQVLNRDFDEEKLCLKSVSMPELRENNIEIYYTEEDFLQLANVIADLERYERCDLLDADFNNNKYFHLLGSNRILVDRETNFTVTSIFSFLNNLYNIFVNTDFAGNSIKLEINDLLAACFRQEFRDYYEWEIDYQRKLQELAADDYVYIDAGIIDREGLTGIKKLLTDIREISKIDSLQEFCSFLERLNFRKLNDIDLARNISRFFDAMLELSSIEVMNIVSNWDKYFNNRPQGYFRMIINYLKYKEVKPLRNNKDMKYKLEDLLSASHNKRENLIIINAARGVIPTETRKNFLLTENLRADLGLQTSIERRLREKYYFFRHIFSSNNVIIYSLKNLEDNITSSPFVEELRLNYKLPVKSAVIRPEHYPKLIIDTFPVDREPFTAELSEAVREQDSLLIDKDDFHERGFSLTYYKYQILKDCYYRFFLESVSELEEEKVRINKKLDLKFIGIFVHEIFADIIETAGPGLTIEKDTINEIVRKKFYSYELKINNYFKKYYSDIFLSKIEKSIYYFMNEINKRINSDIEDLLIEWLPVEKDRWFFYEDEYTQFYLNGRVDLVITTAESDYLIDFKTGGGDTEQLDFYSLLLNPGFKLDQQLNKYIYSVMDEKIVIGKPGSEVDFSGKIQEKLEEFSTSGEYRTVYKSRCNSCPMFDICRVVSK